MQPLAPNASTRASLAGGEEIVFSIDVPAHTAARLVVRQQGIDVGVTLRIAGSALPEHGLNMVGGRYGEEVRYIAISDAPATWHIFIKAAPPRAPRGDFTIATEHKPADDHARAIAEVRQIYQAASDTAWAGDGKSFEKARELYMAVAKRALEIGDKELAAESTYETARMFDQFGEVPTAIEWQLRALVLFRELNRRDRQSRVLNRLGDLSRKIGEVIHSEGYFKEALPLARETGDQYALVDILNNSGLLHLSIGRLEEALDQLQSAIPLAQELNSANVEVALWNNSGEAYLRLGLREQAVAAHERALDRVRRSDLPKRRLGRTLHLLAVAYFETGNGAKAEVSLREALLVFEQAKDAAHTADALGFLGRMQHANGDAVSAVASFERALPMLQQAQNRLGQGTVLMTWSQVDLDRANTDASLEKLQAALNLFRQTGNRSAQAKALYLRALSLQQKQNIDAAIEAISEAIEIIEVMRSEITRVELRTSYLAAMRRYYDLYIDLLQQRGRTADAFSVSERARARTLLESLAESATKIRKGVDPALLKRERTVQAELNAKTVYRAQVVLKEGEKSTRAVALGNATEQLLDEWKEIQAKIRASSPAYAALRMPQPVTAESVQKSLLDSDSALIAYHLGDSRTYAWVIDKRSITVHSLASRSKLDEMARHYHELLSREIDPLTAAQRDAIGNDISKVGRRIADAVWKPLASRVKGKRVLLVADGALQYVPFGALPSASGEPLLVEHEIVYLPSASVLDLIRKGVRPVTQAAAAVFADPVFSADDSRVTGDTKAAAAPPHSTRGGPYTRLRFSRNEAQAIFDAAGDTTFRALDFTAAKKTVSENDLRKYRIVHFATHGYLDTEQPELSGLVLSLVDTSGKSIDGFLNLHEIYNLDLDADLVVLSACRTALGKEVHGEGLIGLTRGFMYAGASRVVSSIWNVDDRASAQLMSRFYAVMLSKNLAPGAALREAQLSLLRQERWKNPHYWAAFSLQGEWR